MGVTARVPDSAPFVEPPTIPEDVHEVIPGSMPPFDQDGLATRPILDLASREPLLLESGHRMPQDRFRFGKVGRHQASQGEQMMDDPADLLGREEARSILRDHDRVEHQRQALSAHFAGHGTGDPGIPQGPGLDHRHREIVENRPHLGGDEFGIEDSNLLDPLGILDGEERQCRRPVDPVSLEGFEVGLDSRPSRGIGSGHG